MIAALFLLTGRVTPGAAARAIDLDLLLVLFALLVAVEVLRASGYLDVVVHAAVDRFATTRGFALALIALSGALASLLTNDVTLFVVIPFTIMASRISDFDVEDAVVLEIVAANLLGCLTPLGNPQNLFVFHRSGWSAAHFVTTMLPLVDGRAAIAGAICFALVLAEIARLTDAWPAAIASLIAGALFL